MKSPAKLNLFLHLLGKRSDGFTELDSLVGLLDWHDELHIRLRLESDVSQAHAVLLQDVAWSSNDTSLQDLGESNLVMRAIRALQTEWMTHHGVASSDFPFVSIHLEKHLPYQAGLGSASSNAATALQDYHQLLSESLGFPQLSQATLGRLAASIGSDVSLFLQGTSFVRMQGRGEIISPVEVADSFTQGVQLLMAQPELLAISTQAAYAWFHQQNTYRSQKYNPEGETVFQQIQAGATLQTLKEFWTNDFESVILERYPHLHELRKAFYDLGAFHVMLCGSGSAWVAFYDSTTLPTPTQQADLVRRFACRLWQTRFL
jgi:4-diphosphocytidyl-2-C-methyl-D-erythritol kinase